jgi:hypothetical protein
MSKIDWDKLFSLHDETKELKKIKIDYHDAKLFFENKLVLLPPKKQVYELQTKRIFADVNCQDYKISTPQPYGLRCFTYGIYCENEEGVLRNLYIGKGTYPFSRKNSKIGRFKFTRPFEHFQ